MIPEPELKNNRIVINTNHLAGCVILDKKGRLLLLHRKTPTRIQWEIPGGKVEKNETPKLTAIREAKEELNIDIRITKKLGQDDFIEEKKLYTCFWFLAKIKTGILTIKETEKFDSIKFFSWKELNSIRQELSPNTRNLITAYFNKIISF